MIFRNQIEIPIFALDIIDELTAETGVTSVWLIGSRANGNAKIKSDWDILVFSNKEPFHRKPRHECVDVVRVGPLEIVQLEGETYAFPFNNWKWNQIDEQTATYEGTKIIDRPGVGDTANPTCIASKSYAFCLWGK